MLSWKSSIRNVVYTYLYYMQKPLLSLNYDVHQFSFMWALKTFTNSICNIVSVQPYRYSVSFTILHTVAFLYQVHNSQYRSQKLVQIFENLYTGVPHNAFYRTRWLSSYNIYGFLLSVSLERSNSILLYEYLYGLAWFPLSLFCSSK